MFGQVGIWQILIVAVVILILFGRGRISEMMGDFGKGINSFKKGMSDTEEAVEEAKGQIEAPAKEVKDAKKAEKTETPS